MLAAPGAAGLELEIKDDIVFFGELEDFVESGYALAGKFAAEPGAGVEFAYFREGHVVDRALSVGSAIDGVVVDGDEAGVAGQLQVGFDEGSAEGKGLLERSESILGRVTGSSAMRDYQHFSILLVAIGEEATQLLPESFCVVTIFSVTQRFTFLF